MTRFKKYMLSSAALLGCSAGAQAADLPVYKAAPVSYVRICDAFGTGFFYIPGTDTCLRINGQVRAEYTVRGNAPSGNPAARGFNLAGQAYNRDLSVFRARGYLNGDARTQTAYGTIRAFVSYRITQDTTAPGPYGGGSFKPAGAAFAQKTSIFQGFSPNSAYSQLDKGFIQFAGITAGRAQSFFDFDAQSHELLTNTVANSNQVTEMFAYTYAFGKGFSATISVEDAIERRIGDNGFTAGLTTAAGNQLNPTATRSGYLAYAGETIPDIVANLRIDQDWGSAQISGAYHQLSSFAVTLNNGALVTPGNRDGFAGLAGVKVLLPMVAKGDNFVVQGSYEQGAMDYVNPLNYQPVGLSSIYANNTSIGVPVNDGFIRPDGKIGMNVAYGGYGAYQHYWTPDWNSSLFGDYLKIRNPKTAQLLGVGADNASIFQVGGNLIWTPVKDFIIGGEVLYSNMTLTGLAPGVVDKPPSGSTSLKNPDDIRGRLSLRRAF